MEIEVILVDIGVHQKPNKEMGVRTFKDWEDVVEHAQHWCKKYDYTTWRARSWVDDITESSILIPKKSKKSPKKG